MEISIDEVLTRGVTNIIPSKEELKKELNSGRKLNVYLGIDPTATKIHLGNAVPLRKLQSFMQLGHHVTLVIGDFTALIGDSSDKESERPVLTYEEIQENFKTYEKQASKIVDFSKVSIKFNGEWLKQLNFVDVIKLCQHFSVGDFVSRELIRKRLDSGKKVGLHEVLYPVMQGYDSYFMDTDIQIGGPDQTFNMQAGRNLQKDLRNKQSFVVVTGYLEGTDGRKMSKSWGNAVWLEDDPSNMYGKIMSLNDNLLIQYFTNATNYSQDQIDEIDKKIKKGENPMLFKKELAYAIVAELHSDKDAKEAQNVFEKTFQERKPEYNIQVQEGENLADTIAPYTAMKSVSDAKRYINQKSVDVNGLTIKDPTYKVKTGDKIKIGEKVFIEIS